MQIDVNKGEETAETDDVFQTDITAIINSLDKAGFDRLHSGDDIAEYKRKCDCFKQRLHESIVLLNAFSDDGYQMRKEEILKLARKSSKMIAENNDDFYKHQNGWKLMNESMKESSTTLNSLLLQRGIKQRKVMSNSLFILLEAESVENLDLFWKEYQDGRLIRELQKVLFPRETSNLTFAITEQNYENYRKFLGWFIFVKCLADMHINVTRESICILQQHTYVTRCTVLHVTRD